MTIQIPAPNPKQAAFFASRARFTGYGGARGGGKSWALRNKALLLALRYPGLNILLVRKTLPELRENHLLPLLGALHGVADYNSNERAFRFPNKSRIRLGYCAAENDIFQYQGQEYDVIMIEECTHFTWAQVQFLMTCNRSVRADFKPRMYFTGNPGGVGHNWFRRLFVKRAFTAGERPEDFLFIPATVDDNHVLMKHNPEYVAVLDSLPDKMRRAHRYGDWDIFEGQFFEEFSNRQSPLCEGGFATALNCKEGNPKALSTQADDRAWTHVIKPFEVPPGWPIYRSFDFGYARPFSCGWWAADHDGRLYRILELYGCGRSPNEGVKWTPDKIFSEIARVEHEHRWLKGRKILGVADPSIWDASRGESVADTAARHGVYFTPGDNARLPGWMQVHYRLSFDENGVPMMYIFDTCKAFIRTIPELRYDQNRPEDLDTNGEDHVADEVRYLCMARPIKPVDGMCGGAAANRRFVYGDDPLELGGERYGG